MSIRIFEPLDDMKSSSSNIRLTYEKNSITITANGYTDDVHKLKSLLAFVAPNPEMLSKHIWKELQPYSPNMKIALFSSYYKQRKGMSYTPLKKDVKSLEEVPVSVELLKTYFDAAEWWCKVKNVGNYVANINTINELHIKGKEVSKMVYPTQYEKDFEAKLTPKQLNEYWKVLNANGYVYKQGRWSKKSE